MTIKVSVKPREDNLFDIWVGDEGDHFVHSSQGYENVEDAERIVHRMWPPAPSIGELIDRASKAGVDIPRKYLEAATALLAAEPVELVVEYRDGTTKTERLR